MARNSTEKVADGPQLPGFDVPIWWTPSSHNLSPNALDGDHGYTYTTRELTMMRFLESITDKPDWDKKVFNEEITAKWRNEMANSGKDMSSEMIEFIIKELQWRAEQYQKDGIVQVLGPGITKSDSAIPPELREALKEAARPLEDVPEEEKDYHPRSDGKVIDLVHPSLFPVIYGLTKVLPDRRIGLDDCFQAIGQGELTKHPRIPGETAPPGFALADLHESPGGLGAYSHRFQWLPCDVKFTPDGGCETVSYINNLHPHKHRELYAVVDKILARTIALWDSTILNAPPSYRPHYQRIKYDDVNYLDGETEPSQGDDEDDDDYDERYNNWVENRAVEQPEPGEFKPPSGAPDRWLPLRENYAAQGLQVIVKLANIHLTPEKPEYEGGTWHIEAQLNERICATAIYYYDCENITENTLSFRSRADTEAVEEVGYEQGQHQFLKPIFGFGPETNDYSPSAQITQDLGGVTCRQGRLLTFPNTLQHRVSPFSLVDRSKPGHRKILAFFLIDPLRRTISSANVPPQRDDWCKEWRDSVQDVLASRLPRELQDMVHRDIEYKPITMEQAKQFRLELMDERSVKAVSQNEAFETGGFSLCEH